MKYRLDTSLILIVNFPLFVSTSIVSVSARRKLPDISSPFLRVMLTGRLTGAVAVAGAALGFGRVRFCPKAIVDIHRMAEMNIARLLNFKAWYRIIASLSLIVARFPRRSKAATSSTPRRWRKRYRRIHKAVAAILTSYDH